MHVPVAGQADFMQAGFMGAFTPAYDDLAGTAVEPDGPVVGTTAEATTAAVGDIP
jgi:hypothetical protein